MRKLSTVHRWILYDWANSAFALSMMAAFFPLYFKEIWATDLSQALSTTHLSFGNSIAGLIVALFSPFLAALAGISGSKKSYLIVWAMVAIGATGFISLVPEGAWFCALVMFIIARMGFQFSNLFYDALLIDVAPPEKRHAVSTLGFAFGYLGGAALFVGNVFLYLNPQIIGGDSGADVAPYIFASISLWWFLFALPLWLTPIGGRSKETKEWYKRLIGSLENLKESFLFVKSDKNIALFLLAYWFYIDGVHTIVLMATNFAIDLKISQNVLLISLFLVQLVAFPSSIITGKIATHIGGKSVVLFTIIIYIIITLGAGLFLHEDRDFIFFAILTGVVQGGIQALSRSLFSTIIPEDRTTELFGIYNMVGKFSMILGPLLIGVVTFSTSLLVDNDELATRIGLVSIGLLFITGFFLFKKVDCS